MGKKGNPFLMMLWCFIFLISPALASPVPDTGQTKCYDDNGEIVCPSPWQALHGQDGNYIINPPSYTKLDANGNAVLDSAASWAMVRDNVTGLIWEVKTNKNGIQNYNDSHDADNTYTWYDPDPATNVGNAGTDGNGTDTKDFTDALNSAKFGGHEDWRLPTIKELDYIAELGRYDPSINVTFFPKTLASFYHSATPNAWPSDSAWGIDFKYGYGDYVQKSSYHYVRAVRGGKSVNSFSNNGDGTVTDTSAGLMWQQGTARDAQDNLDLMTWGEALTYCEGLSLAGHADWRLPTQKELLSVVDYSQYWSAIDSAFFPDTSNDNYWSSTTSVPHLHYAFRMDLGTGYITNANYSNFHYVRAVRGGQAGAYSGLRVVIEPEDARSAGAKWRRVGSQIWRDSGFAEGIIPAGGQSVEFKPVEGYLKPGNSVVLINAGQEATLTGTYMQQQLIYVNQNDADCAGQTPCYTSIQPAIGAAEQVKLIYVTNGTYNEDLELAQNHIVTIAGGYNNDFTAMGEPTSVRKITARGGTLTLENMEIQQSSFGAAAQGIVDAGVFTTVKLEFPGTQHSMRPTLETLKGRVIAGTVEDYLLRSRSGLKDNAYELSEPESEFLKGLIRNLYLESLGREPQPWALDLWGLYISYLTETLHIYMDQALWDVASVIFGSEEYASKGKGIEALVGDAFRGLLWRNGTPAEKDHVLERDLTTAQMLYEIASLWEYTSMIEGAFSRIGDEPGNGSIAGIYIVLLDRLPDVDELQRPRWNDPEREAELGFYLGLVEELACSEEFNALANGPEKTSSRIGRAKDLAR